MGCLRRAAGLALLVTLFGLPARPVMGDEALTLDLPRALQAARFSNADASHPSWLAAHQLPNGSWSAAGWDRWCMGLPQVPEPRLPGRAQADHDLTATALALCAYLGAGYTHRGRNPLARVVAHGLRWLKRRQGSDGSFARPGDADPLAAHALATLAVTECFGMTDSPVFREPCRRALDALLASRTEHGTWPRANGEGVDALATLWAALALKSAELIDKDATKRGRTAPLGLDATAALAPIAAYFRARTDPESGIIRATSGRERERGASALVLTAAGALARIFAGESPRERGSVAVPGSVHASLDHLRAHPPTADPEAPEGDGLYAWIGALATYQAGGRTWKVWSQALEEALVAPQHREGDACRLRGSWTPRGPWALERGRVAMTAIADMGLSVFYRYDRVFGAPSALGAAPTPRLRLLSGGRTWSRSSLPAHAARMELAGGGSLPFDAVHVRADVEGVRAQVVLDYFLTNTTARSQEGTLDLRLPDGAAPYYLAFGEAQLAQVPLPGAQGSLGTDLAALEAASAGPWGRVREARMAPVERATEAFETIVRGRRDPALLTWSGAGVFHLRVFPLLPSQQHRIVVAYEVDLTPVGEDAELLLSLPQGVPVVRVAAAAPGSTWTAEPEAPSSQGVRTWERPTTDAIRLRVAAPGATWLVGSDAAGREHTAAWVRPPVPRVPRVATSRARFLIDVSASAKAGQVAVWRALVPAILEANRDRLLSFAVGFFDHRLRWWRAGEVSNTPENVAALSAALATLEPGGATDLVGALAAARTLEGPADLFLFTDGVGTWGRADPDAVLAEVVPGRAVFTYATGLGAENRALLASIARRSGGALFSVLGLADVPAAAGAHRHHAWAIESIALSGVDDLLVAGDPDRIHPGQRLRLAGRGRPAAGAGLVMRLARGGERRTVTVPVGVLRPSPVAARAYGQAAVGELEEAGEALRWLAIDYATHFRVVRASCALVMLESEADYERFGLDERGHATVVAAEPVLPALAAVPQRPASKGEPRSSWLARARKRRLPTAFVARFAPADPAVLSPSPAAAPLPDDPVLRALAGGLDGEDGWHTHRRAVALHLHALGRSREALALLDVDLPPHRASHPTTDWLLARAAAAADRPWLALYGFEAALGDALPFRHREIAWVIASDYARHLRRLLAGAPEGSLAVFAQARLASLERWRELLGDYAPPSHADLVVLHVPFHWRDRPTIEVRGAAGEPAALRRIPGDGGGDGPQMTIVPRLPGDPWTVRLVRPPDLPAAHRDRTLVIVVRDWGREAERVVLLRSHGPQDAPLLLRVED